MNGVRLLPVGDSEVRGTTPDPTEWTYRCSASTGRQAQSPARFLPLGSSTFGPQLTPARPWRGISGLRRAGLSSDLLSALETRLGEEVFCVCCECRSRHLSTELRRQPANSARRYSVCSKGQIIMAETMMGAYGEGKPAAPSQDWAVKRIGGNPPDVLRALRSDVGMDVCSALGVPPSLFAPNADRNRTKRVTSGAGVHCYRSPLLRRITAHRALR